MSMATLRISREAGKHRGSFRYTLKDDGHYFHCYMETLTAMYLRCHKRSCPVRAVYSLYSGEITLSHDDHNHRPSPTKSELEELIARAASLKYASFQEIFEDVRNSHPHFPTYVTLRSTYYAMYRAKMSALPPAPTNLIDLKRLLDDPQYSCLTATPAFADNIYVGSTTTRDGYLIILLASKSCIDYLQIVPSLFVFQSAVTIRGVHEPQQVYTIATFSEKVVIPLARILYEGDKYHALVAGLTLLRSQICTWSFSSATCESHIERDAFQRVFNVTVNFSLFAYVQDIIEFSKSCINDCNVIIDKDLSDFISLCCTIPMLPEHILVHGLNTLEELTHNFDRTPLIFALRLLQHIEGDWVNDLRNRSLFSMCCSSERTHNGSDQMRLQIEHDISRKEKTFYQYIGYLVRTEQRTSRTMRHIRAGRKPSGMICKALSDDPEILVMLNSILRPNLSLEYAVKQMLTVCASKIKHIIDRLLVQGTG